MKRAKVASMRRFHTTADSRAIAAETRESQEPEPDPDPEPDPSPSLPVNIDEETLALGAMVAGSFTSSLLSDTLP